MISVSAQKNSLTEKHLRVCREVNVLVSFKRMFNETDFGAKPHIRVSFFRRKKRARRGKDKVGIDFVRSHVIISNLFFAPLFPKRKNAFRSRKANFFCLAFRKKAGGAWGRAPFR